ncbi:hypothetical protein AU106_gp263 [Sinorhizobium phage phiM9]|uniref:Uncharacterized protein n=1 Tax=Sinorhizobium phage phiM9 TaxID=1636182 RepID=A0A0F6THN8_9CAUD|nr:hypothetical protein AU106_gp263 [Sinorhizobium phage phiM9]AKE44894.1 hypothetical protein Sm_phiM9_267 [Sinorhizobium phage phiM9]
MQQKIVDDITAILRLGAVSPKNVLNVCVDIGHKKLDFQLVVQIGLERGLWHLDKDMNLALDKGVLV